MESIAGLPPSNKADMIISLMSLERDVISAYDEAISRMRNTPHSEKLRAIRSNHCRHIADLTHTARKEGAEIPERKSKASRVLDEMGYDEKVMLEKIASNMNSTFTAYRTALCNAIIDGALRETCKSALYDERRHRQWLNEVQISSQ